MVESFTGPFRFLSNFYPCEVVVDDVTYPSVEHAYQASRTLDTDDRDRIRRAPRAGDAKSLGAKVKVRPDWDEIKREVMHGLLRQKFVLGSDLAGLLLSTKEERIVEGNWWGDTYWGVCRGVGENHLGRLLQEVRASLRAASHVGIKD